MATKTRRLPTAAPYPQGRSTPMLPIPFSPMQQTESEAWTFERAANEAARGHDSEYGLDYYRDRTITDVVGSGWRSPFDGVAEDHE
jgi:hypothetical protein